jgi:hypothetical protein
MPPNKLGNSSGDRGGSSVTNLVGVTAPRGNRLLSGRWVSMSERSDLKKVGTRTIVLDKLVILSSVSSVEGLPSPETSQGNALRADDLTDDIDTTDDISSADDRAKADDILMADDLKENIVSYRTIEQQRISRLADDSDDKNSRSTSFARSRRFKIEDLVRDS